MLKSLDDLRVRNLKQFFVDYDAFEGRIFELWELQAIFYHVKDPRVFDNLYHENNRKEPLKAGQLSLRYLIDVLE